MVRHPIYVPRQNYRGRDQKKLRNVIERNQIAADVERKINELLLKQTEPVRSYLWMEISNLTGYPYETVRDLGFAIDGGHNGFTAWHHDLTYEQAMFMLGKNELQK